MEFLLQRDKYKYFIIVFTAFLLWNAIPVLAAEVEFFPLKDLQPGMKGYGKTVISGRKIEKFDV
ncbi:MAG: hypothetical protein IKP71_02805, partial [Candidatus Riflebacteria bacterium]|nr:hypothetical protein [Candidatus Riflebacteria bacterium]